MYPERPFLAPYLSHLVRMCHTTNEKTDGGCKNDCYTDNKEMETGDEKEEALLRCEKKLYVEWLGIVRTVFRHGQPEGNDSGIQQKYTF